MASREQNEAVAGLLRQTLAKDGPADACPDANLLAAYFDRSLANDEVARFDLHLSTCGRCRTQLAAMVRAEAPKAASKTFWLLDWRLLSATALVMVIATIWFLRRPTELAPVAQNVAPAVAAPAQAPKPDLPAAGNASPATADGNADAVARESTKKPAAALRLPPSPANAVAQLGEGKVGALNKSRHSTAREAGSGSLPASNNGAVQTNSAELATPQPARVGGGQGGGVAPKESARSTGAVVAPQQVPPSSQMVLVQPNPPAPQPPASSSSKTGQPAAKETPAAPPAVASGSQQVEVSAAAQTQAVTNDKQSSDKLIGLTAANEAAVQVQTLEQRSREKVIDTPIATIKWRITAAGFVERSEDGGVTWAGQEPDPEAHLIAGSAPTDKVCWLVGKEGVVLVTKDAANWKKIPPPANADITSVSAKNASDATVTTSDGRRFTTHNEGKKWKPAN